MAWPPAALAQVASGLRPLMDKLGELAGYLDVLDWHPRACTCLGTCHVFAAGHDVTAPGGPAALVDALGDAAGRVRLVHANDFAAGCGSRRDRHANIGGGQIAAGPLGELLRHPALAGAPFIVETPRGQQAQAVHAHQRACLVNRATPGLDRWSFSTFLVGVRLR